MSALPLLNEHLVMDQQNSSGSLTWIFDPKTKIRMYRRPCAAHCNTVALLDTKGDKENEKREGQRFVTCSVCKAWLFSAKQGRRFVDIVDTRLTVLTLVGLTSSRMKDVRRLFGWLSLSHCMIEPWWKE